MARSKSPTGILVLNRNKRRFQRCATGWSDYALALWLIPAALRASRLARTTPLTQALGVLLSRPPSWSGLDQDTAACAVGRAVHAARFLGGLDTCLTRALLLASLLREQADTSVHIGFRTDKSQLGTVNGHAWVTVNGRNVSDYLVATAEQHAFAQAFTYCISSHIQTVPERRR